MICFECIDCIFAFFSMLFSSSMSWCLPRHVDVGTRVILCGREFRSSAQYEHRELSTPLKLTLVKTCNKKVKCQTPKPPESCRLCHRELVTSLSHRICCCHQVLLQAAHFQTIIDTSSDKGSRRAVPCDKSVAN